MCGLRRSPKELVHLQALLTCKQRIIIITPISQLSKPPGSGPAERTKHRKKVIPDYPYHEAVYETPIRLEVPDLSDHFAYGYHVGRLRSLGCDRRFILEPNLVTQVVQSDT
ncbi:hypothetical protein M404DRAFT_994452 [Pisolithus tinctorius Marx 270]|uniref:Uncharacterized protein n=1 Tax=Pisolithus tinctorius Marx 270 TaxID=870435 RepID=A0A0C3PRR7_PISTI|nr:hypothetical protein M404DRAFT_994452 [Pisolithus tinctorius Marx 270]